MARISIDRLARPEEEELSAGQAGKVVGAGLTFYNPYTGITTYTGFSPALGPFTPYNFAYGLRPPVFYNVAAPYPVYPVAPIYPAFVAPTPVVSYYGW
jgi:hypothetical protein